MNDLAKHDGHEFTLIEVATTHFDAKVEDGVIVASKSTFYDVEAQRLRCDTCDEFIVMSGARVEFDQ